MRQSLMLDKKYSSLGQQNESITKFQKTPSKFNKMVAVMGAITMYKDNFKYITKSGYFNSDDTIEFLS